MIIKPPARLSGVYALRYTPSGAVYVGSSGRCVGNRLSWHISALRGRYHGSPLLQETWDESIIEDWEFEVLEICQKEQCKSREAHWSAQFDYLLNEKVEGRKYSLSPEIRQKQRSSRAVYLDTPGAREDLSRRAVLQHEQRRFGY